MEEAPDKIAIELKVTAVQMDADIWMQGDLEIFINGVKPYSGNDIVDYETLLKSLESEGEYFIFSCCCGIPGCSKWIKGIHVTQHGNIIKWVDANNGTTWRLGRSKIEDDLKTIREEVEIFKKYFDKKQIEYVGVGVHFPSSL